MPNATLGPEQPFDPDSLLSGSLPLGPINPSRELSGRELSVSAIFQQLSQAQIINDKLDLASLSSNPLGLFQALAHQTEGEQKELLDLVLQLFHTDPHQQITLSEFVSELAILDPHLALQLLEIKSVVAALPVKDILVHLTQASFQFRNSELLTETLCVAKMHNMLGQVMHEAFKSDPRNISPLLEQVRDNVKTKNEFVHDYLRTVLAHTATIQAIPSQHHNLSPLQTLEISLFAQKELEKGASRIDVGYFKTGPGNVARTVVIDFTSKSFIVLSKQYGVKGGKGATKQATDAIKVSERAERLIRLVNKGTAQISEREIALSKLFNSDLQLVVEHTNKTGAPKTSLIERAYDGDLLAHINKQKLDASNLQRVFLGAGETLRKVHEAGYVHFDVKLGNILVRTDPATRSMQAKLTDFGLTYKPPNEIPLKDTSYGTASYTAPETLDLSLRPVDPIHYGQGADMYALGCTLYKTVTGADLPWIQKFEEDALSLDIVEAQREGYEAIVKTAASTQGKEKFFLELARDLLNPDPEQRIGIQEYMARLSAFKV